MQETIMVNCPKCNTEFEEYKDICPECGTSISTHRKRMHKLNKETVLVKNHQFKNVIPKKRKAQWQIFLENAPTPVIVVVLIIILFFAYDFAKKFFGTQ